MNAPYVQSSPVANVTPVFKRFVPWVVARHLTRHFHLHTPSIDGEGTSSSAKCVVVRGCHLLSHGHIQWTFLAIVCVCLMPFVRQYIPIVSLLSMYTPYPLLQESTALVRRIAGKIIKPRNHSQFRQPFKLPRFSSIPASNDSTLKGSSINVGSFKGAVSNSKHIRLYPTALHDT